MEFGMAFARGLMCRDAEKLKLTVYRFRVLWRIDWFSTVHFNAVVISLGVIPRTIIVTLFYISSSIASKCN